MTRTLLFSDVVGFTRLTTRLGDREAHRLLSRHRSAVAALARRHGGAIAELRGDGALLVFDAARECVRFGLALQRELALRQEGADRVIRVRMGAHSGPVILDDLGPFGSAVIVAARIAERAQPGQILVSERVREQLGAEPGVRFGPPDRVQLKGFDEVHRVYCVDPVEEERSDAA